MIQWHEFEVDSLNKGPQHPILLQRGPVCAIKLVLRTCAFHDSHATQETEQVCGCEDRLIGEDSCGNCRILAPEFDPVLEEFEPGCCCRTEDS